jgi:DNA-binding NarL/FixJ family response regulator
MSIPAEELDEADDKKKLRILLVDDHDVVHWGFRQMLGTKPWVERTLSSRNGEEAYALAERYKPDVALVDLFLGEESGAEVCRQLRERSPETKVLLISGAGQISPEAAKEAGASGFIPKEWGAADIARAVRMVGLGMTVFQPQVDDDAAATSLTPREREVLDMITRGATNREIAAALNLSPHTIHEHTSSLYRKLGARNRADAVQRAHRLGLVGGRQTPHIGGNSTP